MIQFAGRSSISVSLRISAARYFFEPLVVFHSAQLTSFNPFNLFCWYIRCVYTNNAFSSKTHCQRQRLYRQPACPFKVRGFMTVDRNGYSRKARHHAFSRSGNGSRVHGVCTKISAMVYSRIYHIYYYALLLEHIYPQLYAIGRRAITFVSFFCTFKFYFSQGDLAAYAESMTAGASLDMRRHHIYVSA